MTARLLLVELLNDDPFNHHRVRRFPYFQGFARQHGVATRWVSVAAGRDARPDHAWQVDLPDERWALLREAIRDFDPNVLVFNEHLGPAMSGALARDHTEAVRVAPPDPLFEGRARQRLSELLGIADEGGGGDCSFEAIEDAEPDYACRRLYADAGSDEHLVPIFVGYDCLYRRSLVQNPMFDGIEEIDATWPGGCTFCQRHGVPEGASLDRVASVARVIGQLRRYHETTDPEERRSRFQMLIAPMLRWLGDVFAGLESLDLPSLDLFFTCRVDEFLAAEGALREWLPRLADAGHRVHFWQIGLENFSPDENLRFNKGVTSEQIERATASLQELEQAWPETFFFQREGGYGMIVFTPWTRLEDLRINATEIQRLGLEQQYGMLTSVLLVRAGTPLEWLARADGLLLDEGDPPSPFDAICITAWGEDALRWRFRQPEVSAVHEALAALFPGRGAIVGEAVADTVRRVRERAPRADLHAAEALAGLVAVAEASPEATPSRLLERLWETLVLPRWESMQASSLWACNDTARAAVDLGLPSFTTGEWTDDEAGQAEHPGSLLCVFGGEGAAQMRLSPRLDDDGSDLGLVRLANVSTAVGEPESSRFPEVLDAVVGTDGGWLASNLMPRLRTSLALLEEADGASSFLVGGLGDLVFLRRPGERAPVTCRIGSAAGDDAPGFLCGPYRVVPDPEIVTRQSGRAAVRAIAHALDALDTEGDWPAGRAPETSAFQRSAWRALGPSLVPAGRVGVDLVEGSVGVDRITLGFTAEDGARLTLSLESAAPGKDFLAATEEVGLRYWSSASLRDDLRLKRVLARYVRLLSPRA